MVDASAGVELCLSEAALERVSRYALRAPSLFRSEVAATLRRLEWSGSLLTGEVEEGIRRLPELPIELVPADAEHLRRALEIARRFGWAKTYDSEYLALAETDGVPILSIDGRLARSVRGLVDVIAPDKL